MDCSQQCQLRCRHLAVLTGGTATFGPGSLSTFPSKARPTARSESPCWRRSRGGRRLVTTGRGSSSPRCSPRGWWRPAITSRCSPPQTRSPRPACTQPRRVAGLRTRRSTPRSQSACTSHPCSSAPASSTSSTTDSTSCHSRTAISSPHRWSPRSTGSRPTGSFLSTSATTAPPPTCRSATPIDTRICTTPPPSTTASISTRFAIHPSPGEHLLFFGRIHPDKGTAHAIEVARRCGRRLDIAGIIQDEEYFRDEVAPHVDGEQVRYLGAVEASERAEVLGGAHALLHLIDFDEPFGYSVVEAMACGTPVVANARGSMGELITHGVNRLSRRRHRFGGRRGRCGRRARPAPRSPRLAAERFTVATMVDKYVEVYRDVIGKRT